MGAQELQPQHSRHSKVHAEVNHLVKNLNLIQFRLWRLEEGEVDDGSYDEQ
jgi:hypothetical protein